MGRGGNARVRAGWEAVGVKEGYRRVGGWWPVMVSCIVALSINGKVATCQPLKVLEGERAPKLHDASFISSTFDIKSPMRKGT